MCLWEYEIWCHYERIHLESVWQPGHTYHLKYNLFATTSRTEESGHWRGRRMAGGQTREEKLRVETAPLWAWHTRGDDRANLNCSYGKIYSVSDKRTKAGNVLPIAGLFHYQIVRRKPCLGKRNAPKLQWRQKNPLGWIGFGWSLAFINWYGRSSRNWTNKDLRASATNAAYGLWTGKWRYDCWSRWVIRPTTAGIGVTKHAPVWIRLTNRIRDRKQRIWVEKNRDRTTPE